MILKSAIIGVTLSAIVFTGFTLYQNLTQKSEVLYSTTSIVPSEKSTVTFKDLANYVSKKPGTYSLYIKNLFSDEINTYNPTQVYYGASLYKLPFSIGVFKEIESEKISYDTKFYYLKQDYEGGSGVIQLDNFGSQYTVLELLQNLIKESDNIAYNILNRNSQAANIEAGFLKLGLSKEFYVNNNTSVEEMGKFLENLTKTTYINDVSKSKLYSLLSNTSFDDRVHVGLKYNSSFAHKIGNNPDQNSWHDCGIVFNSFLKKPAYVVCVMSEDTTWESFLDVTKEVGIFLNP